MAWDNKVVWSEGMFLRAQHLQQQDRYVERLVRARTEGLRPHGWGLSELQLGRDLLGTGKFALASASGVFQDGTPFSLPGEADHPPPLDPPEGTRDTLVYLAVPLQQPGRAGFTLHGTGDATTRYAAAAYEAPDAVAGSDTVNTVQVGRLRLRLMLEGEDRAGYSCLGLARIAEVKPGPQIVLDPDFIPPSLGCAASARLRGFIDEILGLVSQRAGALAPRLAGAGTGGAAEIADFLLLQLCNRYQPLLAHHAERALLHPEELFGLFLQIAGELATFTAQDRRPGRFEPYRHHDLELTFAPVMRALRMALSAVLEKNAIAIPLQERRYGVRVGVIPDRTLVDTASFVLTVRADLPAEQLRRSFPAQVKIGPVELIRDLVMSALPGITLDPLPVAPRQIPFTAGTVYFRLDRGGSHWKQLAQSGGIAIHVGGDFPQAVLELWAIRS
ncbi:type VI secretion system baseplate subunit TssK [Arenibaculum pallidiluteum]|uniref:type VI secretion system baseplate subunit TssK n=1 Tax=Arenibaculum pallidiluteum TaxID=2812559 RepID=UPI001A96052C|nr:type VI secretion system baseplate subunit TssK [Arenibaculum pallidiluteum]